MIEDEPIIQLQDVSVVFNRHGRRVEALRGIDLHVRAGRALGIVGESGSGKTTLANVLLGLVTPCRGTAMVRGRRVEDWLARHPMDYRRAVQLVFQDPYSALNPRMTAGRAIGEVLAVHFRMREPERSERVGALLTSVGLSPDVANRYPHEFSGGQRQRMVIARALALEPDVLIADEPTSALDVLVQAEIIRLLRSLQDRRGWTGIYISHDLAVIRQICDDVVVLKDGAMVESGTIEEVYREPTSAYTRQLLDAVPVIGA